MDTTEERPGICKAISITQSIAVILFMSAAAVFAAVRVFASLSRQTFLNPRFLAIRTQEECVRRNQKSRCSAAILTRVCVTASDVIVIAVVWYYSRAHRMLLRELPQFRRSLVLTMLRDGCTTFATLALLNTLYIVVYCTTSVSPSIVHVHPSIYSHGIARHIWTLPRTSPIPSLPSSSRAVS
ncbi:hypothetical protein DAEQUDRAFT_597758 [Daedalea quercina L-15889]|uniref:Uncharacterized protein n=1 Tax=Daedalea quercina L-15889 TaxID=1314783 RepID=A0A165LPC8_9APHY|nr:hypothetical protein DAEQUDRAFT_597758 [Daedalea quercina L-15889]